MVTLSLHNRTKLGNHPWDAQRKPVQKPQRGPGNCLSKKERKRLREVNLQGPRWKEGLLCAKNTMNTDLTLMGELNKIINAYKLLRELMGDMILFTI